MLNRNYSCVNLTVILPTISVPLPVCHLTMWRLWPENAVRMPKARNVVSYQKLNCNGNYFYIRFPKLRCCSSLKSLYSLFGYFITYFHIVSSPLDVLKQVLIFLAA